MPAPIERIKPAVVALVLVIAAVLLRLLFWAYSQRDWEDALITVLHAEQFWRGEGLTLPRFDPVSPPVHGFTSPISVLIPLLGGAIDWAGTWCLTFMKAVSALAGGAAVWVAWRLMRRISDAPALPWLVMSLGYLAVEHHQILWGMAGMETEVVTLILFYLFYACAVREPSHLALAIALAMYARPDYAFLNLIVFAYCWPIFRTKTLVIFAAAAALYLPWLIFTLLYYPLGPLPNTVLAKAYGYGPAIPSVKKFLDILLPLGPSFGGHGTGYWSVWDNGAISLLVSAFFIAGSVVAIRRRVAALYVPIAFVVVYWGYYVFLVGVVFGWYVVPLSAATVFVAGFGLVSLLPRPRAAFAAAALYGLTIVTMLPVTFRAERDIQAEIENPVRVSLGKHLAQIMTDGERAAMEPLGYSSYYSRRPIMDYPGLANPDVVAYLRNNPVAGLCAVIDHFRPAYIALRPSECNDASFLADYGLEKTFDAQNIETVFRPELNIDLHFLLYRRKDRGAVLHRVQGHRYGDRVCGDREEPAAPCRGALQSMREMDVSEKRNTSTKV